MDANTDIQHKLLVTFGNLGHLHPRESCLWRIQALDAAIAGGVERWLARRVAWPLIWSCLTIPQGGIFKVRGDYRSLADLFSGAEDAEAPEPPGSGWFAELRRQAARALENWEQRRYILELPRHRQLDLGKQPAILGILNITPDSFSDGGSHFSPEAAVAHGLRMLEEGADAIDIGGESTRPGSDPVPEAEELRRVIPALSRLRRLVEAPISVDTTKAEVARIAIDEGADIINDVSALEADPAMIPLLRERRLPVAIMHMQGRPKTMQADPSYLDATGEVVRYLSRRLEALEREGIERDRVLVDPGIGFGKRSMDNLELMRDIGEFRSLGRPVLIGLSRKSFLGRILGRTVEQREAGTLAAHTLVAWSGVSMLRTHHISNAREMAKVWMALKE